MARILITSGPTRQYIDPVRFLSNASSGRMGCSLAAAAIQAGHDVIIISGPVEIEYPPQAQVEYVVTTDEMLQAAEKLFPLCHGVIGVAAPCDYKPQHTATSKISKTGHPISLLLMETPDIIATLGSKKTPRQWAVGFALETDDPRFRALRKMETKNCDLMVLNSPSAIYSHQNEVEVFNSRGKILAQLRGPKTELGQQIFNLIEKHLIRNPDFQ
ncbi:MAG: phosphopantothenoylcysteine decarboxylase [Planctomycetia bacterium]|nr:phosphopantothenoylcysteine decarboxylase [Planctomycetia bacterium]